MTSGSRQMLPWLEFSKFLTDLRLVLSCSPADTGAFLYVNLYGWVSRGGSTYYPAGEIRSTNTWWSRILPLIRYLYSWGTQEGLTSLLYDNQSRQHSSAQHTYNTPIARRRSLIIDNTPPWDRSAGRPVDSVQEGGEGAGKGGEE